MQIRKTIQLKLQQQKIPKHTTSTTDGKMAEQESSEHLARR